MWFKRGADGLTARQRRVIPLSARIIAFAKSEGYNLTPWQERTLRSICGEEP